MSVLRSARALLADLPLCDPCLGRQFAQRGHGLDNAQRGHALRVALCLEHDLTLSQTELCPLCLGHFQRVEHWAQQAVELLAAHEFSRYLMGTKVPDFLNESEAQLRQTHGIDSGEPLKQSYNREVGKAFGRLWEQRGRAVEVDFHHPQVLVTVDLVWERVSAEINPLYVFGRYRKLVRGIPQTHWPCSGCKGRGCPACGGTGARYPQSVESLIGQPLQALCQGQGHVLHGAGREDIDARMLGGGRPFVIELKRPRKRFFNWEDVARHINADAQGQVEVLGLQVVTGEWVGRVKEQDAQKAYCARVAFDAPVEAGALQSALASLVGSVRQRTPQRVAHRRADLVRGREVIAIEGRLLEATLAEVALRCTGGLYVKELISGDGGRTTPNLADTLGVGARVIELDVTDVLGEFL